LQNGSVQATLEIGMPASDGIANNLNDLATLCPAPSSGGAPTLQRLGEFELLGEIGRGGMGVVYKALESALGRTVALKMLLPGALPEQTDLIRFQTEAAATARLSHPNIVKVHRVGVLEGRHFYSMDYIDGPSLAQRLAEGTMPSRQAARYVAAVARAIDHAHQAGILHRDLKPANVLLDKADQPHVTDFGLAKHFTTDSGQTRTGALLGTPSYMAPEQAAGDKKLGPATDVYGLGALLYELITGRPPFRGETPMDTLLQVMEHEPVPPRLLNPKVDRDLETICLKCLAKHSQDRYPSARALANDLENYLTGESINARSFNVFDRLARTLDRSQFDVEFGPYAAVIYWFAAIVFVVHGIKHLLIITRQPMWTVMASQFGQFGLMALVFWRYRARGLLPTTTAERVLWSVWLGYLVSCTLTSMVCIRMFGSDKMYDNVLYPIFALITGMAFCVLGSSYWGRCYAFAVAFWALAFVMTFDLRWATLEFGGLWTVTLLLIGRRLQVLGKERTRTEPIRSNA
jgi:serine/threonine protein kinase